ncbi:MAG: ABC transporter ATP-binding protein [Pirellulaceae bacterium]|nr:ABC transporter ATP-binding protein [Pirellulaceae bacterium]HJN09659.1 ABC transporter ATP-binding protein [Pirellulaceae bacterium]
MIVLDKVTIQAGQFRLEDASLEVPTGDYGMLMGRTGCGKTTILEAIAGLKHIVSGQIRLGDRDVTTLKPAERNIGYVPQDGALFATMSVRNHLAFALKIRNATGSEIDLRVAELADLLEIRDLLTRFPRNLSGGEKQRVAIGRALAFRPSTLLLDEPLSALDDDTREQMYALLKHVQQATGVSTLHVTHHMQDVLHLGDSLFKLENGDVSKQAIDHNGRAPVKQQLQNPQE